MLEEIGSYDAKTKLPEILRRVQKGEAFTITKRGKAIADIVPSRTDDAAKIDAAISNIMKAKKHTLSDAALKDLKSDGRK
jgi:prevent-host-death family protein